MQIGHSLTQRSYSENLVIEANSSTTTLQCPSGATKWSKIYRAKVLIDSKSITNKIFCEN